MPEPIDRPTPALNERPKPRGSDMLWAWLRGLTDFEPPATGDHVWPVAPGVFAVYRQPDGACRVVCQYEPGDPVPAVAVGITEPGSGTVSAATRLDRRGRAELPAPGTGACRIRVAAHVRDALDVAVLRRLNDDRARHQLDLASANPFLPAALRFELLTGTRLTTPLAERLAGYIFRERPLANRHRWFAGQIGAFEDSYRAVPALRGDEFDWSEPFGVRFTGVSPDREARWRVGSGEAHTWRCDLVSGGDRDATGAVRFETDPVDRGAVVAIVNGPRLAACAVLGQQFAFLFSTTGVCSGPEAEVVVVRLTASDATDRHDLARAGLLVDAWRAAAPPARPNPDQAAFLLLAVFTPQSQELRALPDGFITDPGVAEVWAEIVSRLERVRDALVALLERVG